MVSADYPFREVVVVHSANSIPIDDGMVAAMASRGITLRGTPRTQLYQDWCQAEVQSEWFMYTNTYYSVRRHSDVLVTHDGRSVLPFVEAGTMHCDDFAACRAAVDRARLLYPQASQHAQDNDVIFSTYERKRFCDAWERLDLLPPIDPCVPQVLIQSLSLSSNENFLFKTVV